MTRRFFPSVGLLDSTTSKLRYRERPSGFAPLSNIALLLWNTSDILFWGIARSRIFDDYFLPISSSRAERQR